MHNNNLLHEIRTRTSQKITLRWNNLTLISPEYSKSNKKFILENVSGHASSETFTAIIGPSGSGKTSLLESIARKNNSRGTITLDNVFLTNEMMNEVLGFMYQINVASEYLTALEYMQFICAMKLIHLKDKIERLSYIHKIFLKLGLHQCCETQLADLSGGERKKLFLAAELVWDPIIIFCDEPTTGLDSYNATQVIEILKTLSLENKIVIISVHQPSSEIISYFTNIIMLAEGIQVLSGTLENVSSFFESIHLKCPDDYNLFEFYIKQISFVHNTKDEYLRKIHKMKNQFLQSEFYDSNVDHQVYFTNSVIKREKCPILRQFAWLLWRDFVQMKNNFSLFLSTISLIIITSFVVGVFFSSTNNPDDISGYLYLIAAELMYTALYAVLGRFTSEITLFIMEKNLYCTTAYYIAKILSNIIENIVYPFVYLTVTYLMVNFSTDVLMVIKMAAFMIIPSITMTAYGYMITALFRTHDYINIVLIPLNMLFMLTANVFLNIKTLPMLLVWCKYISPFYYTNEALTYLQWTTIQNRGCLTSSTCYENSTKIIEILEINGIENEITPIYLDIYGLLILTLVMHVIACIALICRRKNK